MTEKPKNQYPQKLLALSFIYLIGVGVAKLIGASLFEGIVSVHLSCIWLSAIKNNELLRPRD